MRTTSDILITPLSGQNYIDALLDTGPDWNFATNTPSNTITYTFSTASGNETFTTTTSGFDGTVSSFSGAQQVGARAALAYVSSVTGIKFVETSTGTAAQLHFANADLNGSTWTSGLCSWAAPYSRDPNTNALLTYKPNAYVYLDNVEFAADNTQIVVGSFGYETLLHELGHSLGLKHPFDDLINLPYSEDNTQNTLMSYNSVGEPHAVYSQYDIAALNWLYGTDGLGGAFGIGSSTGARYLTGTSGNDVLLGQTTAGAGGAGSVDSAALPDGSYAVKITATDLVGKASSSLNGAGSDARYSLSGLAGNDIFDGKGGIDTLIYASLRADFTVSKSNLGFSVVSGATGTDTLLDIERVQFSDTSMALDVDGHGGQAYRLYAVFDRPPDLVGLGFWIDGLDNGVTLEKVADEFITSNEFVTKYGANQNNTQFLTTLYNHVMHRQPDDSGFAFWLSALDTGVARAHVLKEFTESPENTAQVIGAIQNGVEYTLWHG